MSKVIIALLVLALVHCIDSRRHKDPNDIFNITQYGHAHHGHQRKIAHSERAEVDAESDETTNVFVARFESIFGNGNYHDYVAVCCFLGVVVGAVIYKRIQMALAKRNVRQAAEPTDA